MKLDTENLRKDLIRSTHPNQETQKQLCDKIGIARSTFWRLKGGHELTVSTLLKIIKHLEKPINNYIINDV